MTLFMHRPRCEIELDQTKTLCFSGWVFRGFRALLERGDPRLLQPQNSGGSGTALTAWEYRAANLSVCLAARQIVLPSTGAIWPSSFISFSNCSGNRVWAPSLIAFSGFG